MDDIAVDDISEHLKGVEKIVHSAAPLPLKQNGPSMFAVSPSFSRILMKYWWLIRC